MVAYLEVVGRAVAKINLTFVHSFRIHYVMVMGWPRPIGPLYPT